MGDGGGGGGWSWREFMYSFIIQFLGNEDQLQEAGVCLCHPGDKHSLIVIEKVSGYIQPNTDAEQATIRRARG